MRVSSGRSSGFRRVVDLGLSLAALGVLFALTLKAALCIDGSHDTWWYHLPWAARLAGLSPAHAYEFGDYIDQFYAGLPVLAEWLQGWLWRLTGRPEAANFVALISLILFVVFLRLRFRIPMHLSFIALLAVPLIQIHATAAYVDLPANLALSAALLLLIPLISRQERNRPGDLAAFFLACALAAHIKLQLVPLVAMTCGAGVIFLVLARFRVKGGAARPATAGRVGVVAMALILVGAIIFAVPLHNLARLGNPFYPMAIVLGPLTLPGPHGAYIVSQTERLEALNAARVGAFSDAATLSGNAAIPVPLVSRVPEATASAELGVREPVQVHAQPLAWVRSVLEIGMAPVLGQGQWGIASVQDPPLPETYGGFFGWYVGFQLLLFAVLVARRPRARSGLVVLFVAATLGCTLAPNLTLLRYYMFWIILLISLNLLMLKPAVGAPPAGRGGSDLRRLVGVVNLAAFLLVVYTTRAEFIQPRSFPVEDLIVARRDPNLLAQVVRHPATCLAGEIASRVFLYAPLFNPGRDYRLKAGPMAGERRERIADCGPGWTPVIAERLDAGLIE